MLEIYASNPIIGLSVVLLLLALLQNLVAASGWRMYLAFVIAFLAIVMQYAVRFCCNSDLLWVLAAVMVVYIAYCAWLTIWRDRNVPSMTTRRRVVMAMVVGLVCLPAVVMNFDSLETWRCRRNWHAALFENPVDRIPDDLFGMKLRSFGGPEGMVRETIFRRIGSKREELVYLEDEQPRKVDGDLFATVLRSCTLKSPTPFKVVAESEVIPCSERELLFEKASAMADGIYKDCGFRMSQVAYASVADSQREHVQLYFGHGGNLDAMILWVRKDEKNGVLRLILRDVEMWCNNTSNSLIYKESEGND